MATAILSILVTPVVEIAKCAFVPLGNRLRHIRDCNKNVKKLKDQVASLKSTKDSVQQAVEEAQQRGESINYRIQVWLKKVDEIEEDMQRLDENMSSFQGLCVNLNSKSMLSKEAVEKMSVVHQLNSDGKFDSISVQAPHLAPPPGIETTPTGDFQAFESTKLAMEQIIVALEDDQTHVIGVYGMGGIGKTTLVKQVGKKVKTIRSFDEVVMVTVSQNLDLKRIQTEIAEEFGFQLQEESISVRARRLAHWLNHKKRVLIILDDVWERVELLQLGIPYGADHNGCKIVVTTRSLDVCNEMESQRNIEVKVLSQGDSWKLLKRVAGNHIDYAELRTDAKEVATQCCGLPIALVTLGRALRNKPPSSWRHAVLELRMSRPMDIKGMSEKVFWCIKLSFDYLQSEEAKSCFLYCSVFPEDQDVDFENLVRYGVGERIFNDVETLDEARDRMHAIIDNLKGCSLLMDSDREGCVKLHDVVRDVAIAIALGNEHGFMVKTSTGLKGWPKGGNLENVRRMSLMNNEINQLPEVVDCPKLSVLLLQNNRLLRNIPIGFFSGIKSLQVLDLSNIPHFPSLLIISCLSNLKTLCIECSRIDDVAGLGELNKLEILSLRRSLVLEIPEEVSRLTRLRLLDLTNSRVERISVNILSRLSQLEELRMIGSFSKWEVGELENEDQAANVAELASLDNLRSLYINIDNGECLFEEIANCCQNVQNFYIQVGEDAYYFETTARTTMRLSGKDQIKDLKHTAQWVKELLSRTEELSLIHWNFLESLSQLVLEGLTKCVEFLHIKSCNIENICSSRFLEGLDNLELLYVSSCHNLKQVIVSLDSDFKSIVLPRLRNLVLRDLPTMKSILKGLVPSSCFHNLRSLTVQGCPGLKFLFLPDLAENLEQLVYLEISDCMRLERIISYGVNKHKLALTKKISFPNLCFITLSNLPRLLSYCDPTISLDLPCLQDLCVNSCRRFQSKSASMPLSFTYVATKTTPVVFSTYSVKQAESSSQQNPIPDPIDSSGYTHIFNKIRSERINKTK
ncbi:disease resistance protein At4g27190-like [Mercurialis annua]|uniref:disease resistance protein At4g27190-like n=1 Tax=Mercurialis annua TaxID=3986 RepID=UPI00215E3EC3|nr:disease resistance protein At4g27190-like [Mercurialis annua]XP_050224700.1 disease resistance protein At4g27190-like [Mercurialis annua]